MHLTCKTEVSNSGAGAGASGVSRQDQMHMECGRHRAWGSSGSMSHCASAPAHVPKGSFPPTPSHSTWDADVSPAHQVPQQMRSWSTAGAGTVLSPQCHTELRVCLKSPGGPIPPCTQTLSLHSCHSSLCLQLSPKARLIFVIIWTLPEA